MATILSTPKTLNAALEIWFIQNVLLCESPIVTQANERNCAAETVIYLELYEIDLQLIKYLKSLGKKVILYHMGDERADKNLAAYPLCDLVIRNYYFPEIIGNAASAPQVLWAPNGYRTGIGPRSRQFLQTAASRAHLASFLGWLSNSASFNDERSLFSEAVQAWKQSKRKRTKTFVRWLRKILSRSKEHIAFTKIAPLCQEDLHLLSSKGFSNGYEVSLYAQVMEDSIFAPCPAGNSPETIRLYDALECGCIPISLSHAFLKSPSALAAIGPVPFPILDSWDDLPRFLEEMKQKWIDHPDEINQLQEKCTVWWSSYKQHIANTITCQLERLS